MPQFGNNPYQNPQMNQMGQGGQWNRQQTPTMTGGQQWFGGSNNQQFGGNNGWNNTQPNAVNYQGGGQGIINQQQSNQATTGYGNYTPPTQDTGQAPMIDPWTSDGNTNDTTVTPQNNATPGFTINPRMLSFLNADAQQQSYYDSIQPDMGLVGDTSSGFQYGDRNARQRQGAESRLGHYGGELSNWLSDQYRNVYGGDKDKMMSAMDDYWNSQQVPNYRNSAGLSQEGLREAWRGQNQGAWDYMQNLLGGIWGQ